MYYIHKHQVALRSGGPEEGGWWYTEGVPTGFSLGPIVDEELTYEQCRALNRLEDERREHEEKYDFTSVLSYESNHYSFTVEEFATPEPFPQERPHYE